ncbi:hypothetical protein SeMB42_g04991 [Synchytrium endobioticum]|uniref:Importin N-terminal domain-containing protein n=1 Tax=Synchytrium endobioticum TaxID=286115 RepID=A0A507CUE2_9FUNG|nr:hypothetical protein SeMB42_g04991 [Synchytrium endobioticum]
MRGELQLGALTKQSPEYPVVLGCIAVAQNFPDAQRHLAAITLRNYVDAHWTAKSEHFIEPEIAPEIKARIRSGLIQGLTDPVGKIRVAIAHVVSKIAHTDWPENWMTLFDDLMALVKSGQVNQVHGAMRVMTDFVRDDITDQQFPYITPILLPEMLRILNDGQTHQARIRSRAVVIFREFMNLLYMMAEQGGNTDSEDWIRNYVPGWLDSFNKIMANPDTPNHELGLKLEVIRSINTLVEYFPKYMNEYLQSILSQVWNHMQVLSDRHVVESINQSEIPDEREADVDSDGHVVALDSLMYSLFEFVESVSTKKALRLMFTSAPAVNGKSKKRNSSNGSAMVAAAPFLKELCTLILTNMQITESQQEKWQDDVNQFVQDDEDETFSFTVRVAAQELLVNLVEAYRHETTEALTQAIVYHLDRAKNTEGVSVPYRWKVHESCLLGLGRLAEPLIECLNSNTVAFDLNAFLSQVVLPDIKQHDYPFLQGRALWFASQLASALPKDLLDTLVRASIETLCASHSPIVKIFAIKSITSFCTDMADITVLCGYQGQILQGLANLSQSQVATDEAMPLILNCLLLAAKVDIREAMKYIGGLSQLLIYIWSRYAADPVISESVLDLVELLASNNDTAVAFQEIMIPEIVKVMASENAQKMPSIQAAGIDLLNALLAQHGTGTVSPMYSRIFPELMQLLLNTTDIALLQNGQGLLKSILQRDASVITSWSNGAGVTGITLVMAFLGKVLDIEASESAGLFLGELIIKIIQKAGDHIAPILHALLMAVTNRLATAQMPTFIQSLVVVFAHLIVKQRDEVVRFLAEMNLEGKSGLEIFIHAWCENYLEFQGYYSLKLNATAMCQLYHSPDPRLQTIMVKGDEIVTDDRIRTRSSTRKAPHQFMAIPFPAKAIKLLLVELMQNVESAVAGSRSGAANVGGLVGESDEATLDSDDEDGDDEGWEDLEESGGIELEFLNGFNPEVNQIDEGDDADIRSDPIYHINLKEYLTSFFKDCYSNDTNQFHLICGQYLNAGEQEYLSAICT